MLTPSAALVHMANTRETANLHHRVATLWIASMAAPALVGNDFFVNIYGLIHSKHQSSARVVRLVPHPDGRRVPAAPGGSGAASPRLSITVLGCGRATLPSLSASEGKTNSCSVTQRCGQRNL